MTKAYSLCSSRYITSDAINNFTITYIAHINSAITRAIAWVIKLVLFVRGKMCEILAKACGLSFFLVYMCRWVFDPQDRGKKSQ